MVTNTRQEEQPTLDIKLLRLIQDELKAKAKANGNYINDKVEIRSINGVLTGIYATAKIKEGEPLWQIQPMISGRTYCDTVKEVVGLLRTVKKYQLKPYERYLASRTASHHPLPGLWSPAGHLILEEMLGKAWNDKDYLHLAHHWMRKCDYNYEYPNLDQVDVVTRNAIRIVRVRTENQFRDLVPFHDVINHARGQHENNAIQQTSKDRVSISARFDIQKGEQIAIDYSRSTNELFLQYGFLEAYPRYWKSSYLDFGVKIQEQDKNRKLVPRRSHTTAVYVGEEDAGSSLHGGQKERWKVEFDKKPNPETLLSIQEELQRLKLFGVEKLGPLKHPSVLWAQIDATELKMICDFHAALVEALVRSQSEASILLGEEPERRSLFPSNNINTVEAPLPILLGQEPARRSLFPNEKLKTVEASTLLLDYATTESHTMWITLFGVQVAALFAWIWIQFKYKRNSKTRRNG